jgi:hypothetical protein
MELNKNQIIFSRHHMLVKKIHIGHVEFPHDINIIQKESFHMILVYSKRKLEREERKGEREDNTYMIIQ